MTGHHGDAVWRCHRCQRLNTMNVNFSCWYCKADAPIPPAVTNTTTHSSAAPLTDQEIKKSQTALLELVRETGNVS